MTGTFGDRAHVNTIGAFLVHSCGAPIERAGAMAAEIIRVCLLSSEELRAEVRAISEQGNFPPDDPNSPQQVRKEGS